MNLQAHAILGGGAAIVLAPVLGVQGSIVFWASSVLIDVDHYWSYVSRSGFRNWSPRKMFAFHHVLFQKRHRREFVGLDLCHTAEWFLLVGVAGLWLESSVVLAAFWGMVFHIGLDLLRLAWFGVTFQRALSVVEYWIRRRRLARQGLDPDRVYREVLEEIGVRLDGRPLSAQASGTR